MVLKLYTVKNEHWWNAITTGINSNLKMVLKLYTGKNEHWWNAITTGVNTNLNCNQGSTTLTRC